MTDSKMKESKPLDTKPPNAAAPSPLVGRYFHVFDDDHEVQYQGRVLSQIDDTHYLIQLYEWFVGEPSEIYVVTIDVMTAKALDRGACSWQFYESREHWVGWYEDHPKGSGPFLCHSLSGGVSQIYDGDGEPVEMKIELEKEAAN